MWEIKSQLKVSRWLNHIFTCFRAAITEIVKSDKNPAGNLFDLTVGVAFDGLTGHAAGSAAGQIASK